MASRFQAAPLVDAPSYPNAIAWSQENLIAVASGHLVTIINPASPFMPRGLIKIPTSEPYPIGRVKREDLLTSCLLSTALSRDRRPCVRSISWSPIGLAPNSGCLLAVCTTEGHVKLYRSPFCDFCAEWIEVVDISDRLYDYLAKTKFSELETLSSKLAHEQAAQRGCVDDTPNSFANDLPNSTKTKDSKRKREKFASDINGDSETFLDQLSNHRNMKISNGGSGSRTKLGTGKNCTLPLIPADDYASRSAMLSSLVVAWSPVLRLSSKTSSIAPNHSSNSFSVLAVGGKSGRISFWRIHEPRSYTIEQSRVSACVILIGLLEAHNSWITAISLGLFDSDSNPQILLASGCSDGSVKIWLGNGEELLKSSGPNNAPFVLLKEVTTVNMVSVSVLSLVLPVQSPHKLLLAVGRGSGSVQVWTCDLSSCEFDKAGSYDAHDYVVTGLAWAFDGRCLYSCGQDNYVRGWVLCGSSLCELALPSNTPDLRNSSDIPDVFLSCLGVEASPGNLVVAMVRILDADQLNPMYQARAQKAVVEFIWTGGQQLNLSSNTSSDFGSQAFPGFSLNELAYWESNILWSLKQYADLDKPLVIWDIMAALLAFKQSIPEYVNHILVKWLSVINLGSYVDVSIEKILARIPKSFSKISSRQLHLLNIICRRIILSELKAEEINCEMNEGGPTGAVGEQLTLWMELLFSSERELRERLVSFSFFAFKSHTSDAAKSSQPGYWYPVGIAQMERWVALNRDHTRDQVKVLAAEVGKHERRLNSTALEAEEKCSYCSALVPFDSPEVAFCQGLGSTNVVAEKHKLARCAVCMQVCPTTVVWFCRCCHRSVSRLPPEALFRMHGYPADFSKYMTGTSVEEASKPWCPFCGILLQRLQPEFLLSASPV